MVVRCSIVGWLYRGAYSGRPSQDTAYRVGRIVERWYEKKKENHYKQISSNVMNQTSAGISRGGAVPHPTFIGVSAIFFGVSRRCMAGTYPLVPVHPLVQLHIWLCLLTTRILHSWVLVFSDRHSWQSVSPNWAKRTGFLFDHTCCCYVFIGGAPSHPKTQGFWAFRLPGALPWWQWQIKPPSGQ